jgi:hypothetical protein
MAFNQQQLEKAGVYEAKSSLSSLLTDLEQIAGIAEAVAARQKARAKTGGWTILAGVIGAIAGAATGVGLLSLVSILAIIFGIGWWIYSFFGGARLTGHRVRLDIAKARLAMIQQDAGAQAHFSLRLALASNPTHLSQEAWTGRKNGRQQFFEECWLSLQGPLLDGTVVTDEIKDLKRTRTFTNASGKRKTKHRLTHLVNVRFSYPKELYGDARPAEKALHGEMKVAPSATLRDVRVTEKAITMKALVEAEKEIVTTAGMLSVGGYRILNLARRIAAGQRGNTK